MSAWSCSFTKHELHLRVTAKCCKSFFLALKTRFTPLQSYSCACKFYLRLQSYVHFHKSYHTHANLLGVKLPSYTSSFRSLQGGQEIAGPALTWQSLIGRRVITARSWVKPKRLRTVGRGGWHSFSVYIFACFFNFGPKPIMPFSAEHFRVCWAADIYLTYCLWMNVLSQNDVVTYPHVF